VTSPGDPRPAGPDAERLRGLYRTDLAQALRAPAEAILGYAEMLAEDAPDGDPQAADLERVRAAGARLLEVVGELLGPGGPMAADDPERAGSLVRHELRTPLNQIIGYAELLGDELEEAAERGDGAGAARRPDLERIAAAGRTLLGTIDALLRFSAAEAAPGAVQIDDLVDLARALGNRASSAATEAGTVLVVDDVELNRDVLARRLERRGHRPVHAANGREALERLREEPFDLVLLDMLMPELNGYETLRRMKQDPELAHVPVIMVTALEEAESVVRCLELGAEDYVTKPFDPVVLEARIAASIERKRLRDREALHLARIEEEKRRADRLLRVILPEVVVEELQSEDWVAPRRCPDVAILFTDVVAFTRYCDGHDPEEVLTALQEMVELFEACAERHGLEKIKTIGDAFMAAAGLLDPVADPVLACVRCGLDMVAGLSGLGSGWQVRIGVHCGEVMAGIVGHKKFLYDVWGDTVNTASRVESNGVAGAVCLSRAAWDRVARRCRGHSRGAIPVKGKGEMELFVVDGLVAEGEPAA
jgi:class 3 adenylate cyclase